MSKTILISDDKNLRQLLSLNLSIYLGTEVIVRDNAAKALEILQVLPEVDLVITRLKCGAEESGFILFEHLRRAKSTTALLVLGKVDEEHDMSSCCIDSPIEDNWSDVIKESALLLGVTAKDMVEKVVPNLFPMDISLFKQITTVPCDVYIKLSSGVNNSKYVKRIKKNDTFDKQVIQRYITQGLSKLYVPKDFRVEITENISRELCKKLKDPSLSNEERVDATAQAYDLASDLLSDAGFESTEETKELVEGVVQSMFKTALDNKKSTLGKLMALLLQNQNSYCYAHSQMVATIASTIIEHSSWGNKEQKLKLCYVAFFHDITLFNDDHARIRTESELQELDAPEKVKNKIRRHALDASKLISTFPSLPIGTDTIIKQHHGSASGETLPEVMEAQMSPLAVTFYATEEFVDEVLRRKEEGSKIDGKDIIYDLNKKHQQRAAIAKSLELINKFIVS